MDRILSRDTYAATRVLGFHWTEIGCGCAGCEEVRVLKMCYDSGRKQERKKEA